MRQNITRGSPLRAPPRAGELFLRGNRGDGAVGRIDPDLVLADVHHVDDPSAELFEVDLTELAVRSFLRCGDRLAERDRGLREELLAVVERTRLDRVTVVPDQAAAPCQREGRADEDQCQRGTERHEQSFHPPTSFAFGFGYGRNLEIESEPSVRVSGLLLI